MCEIVHLLSTNVSLGFLLKGRPGGVLYGKKEDDYIDIELKKVHGPY